MLWFKRLVCGIVALMLIVISISLLGNFGFWRILFGVLSLVSGITLSYIAIMQGVPKYSFWITLLAITLSVALYFSYFPKSDVVATNTESKETPIERKEVHKKEVHKKTNPLSAYPKIGGKANFLSANVIYIGGRYVRLFGIDAPDIDQVCSDTFGASYNCGEEAVSWIRSWIDDNYIDCYLLKIYPNGQDLATCLWGEYDIGAALVSAGWGVVNRAESDIYVPYQVKAKTEQAGLWQGTFYLPEDWRNIKRNKNNFKLKKRFNKKLFNFSSWF